jgi:hypothetical protein
MREEIEFGARFVGVAAGLGGRGAAFFDHFAVEVFDPEGGAGAARAEREDQGGDCREGAEEARQVAVGDARGLHLSSLLVHG